MRGENMEKILHGRYSHGSSPHARGKHLRCIRMRKSRGLIPACAGKTVMDKCKAINLTAHPRMRGENGLGVSMGCKDGGSSPHARGKHGPRPCHTRKARLIPACAGKTMTLPVLKCRAGAHPRMRGENWRGLGAQLSVLGSSPHARGKRRAMRAKTIPQGLIPACAGKTWNTTGWRRLGKGSSPHARGKLAKAIAIISPRRLIPACAGKTHLGPR